ncbi:MAG TPA: DUF892 family protein [Qipengyuania sp.]|nr:DUF892 family protein [Qipengyuania sp.]
MSKTSTARQLLIVALQDLHDAERAWEERGTGIAGAAGESVKDFLLGDLATAADQRARLETMIQGLGAPIEGDPNIWLRAILDDATRDIASNAFGPVRDTALTGALRKGKQAERVSYETAIALADALNRAQDAKALRRSRDEEAKADDALVALLGPLTDEAARLG